MSKKWKEKNKNILYTVKKSTSVTIISLYSLKLIVVINDTQVDFLQIISAISSDDQKLLYVKIQSIHSDLNADSRSKLT